MQEVANQLTMSLLQQPIFWIVIIFGVICLIFEKNIVGKAGEHWAKKELEKLNDDYLIINDLMIKTKDNKTHQIDHLVISKYGIFVIETKQWNGYIIGNDYDKKWTIIAGKRKYYSENPIHQNYGHIKALQEILNIDINKFISIVYIPSTVKTKIKSNNISRAGELTNKITAYRTQIIDNPSEIYRRLNNLNIIDKEKRKEHIQYAKNVNKQKEFNGSNICPWCGGQLVEKNGKYGKFIGCSNYPKCRYIKR